MMRHSRCALHHHRCPDELISITIKASSTSSILNISTRPAPGKSVASGHKGRSAEVASTSSEALFTCSTSRRAKSREPATVSIRYATAFAVPQHRHAPVSYPLHASANLLAEPQNAPHAIARSPDLARASSDALPPVRKAISSGEDLCRIITCRARKAKQRVRACGRDPDALRKTEIPDQPGEVPRAIAMVHQES